MLTPTTCHTVACVAASTIRAGTATSARSRPIPCVSALASSSIVPIIGTWCGGECISCVILKRCGFCAGTTTHQLHLVADGDFATFNHETVERELAVEAPVDAASDFLVLDQRVGIV